MRPVIFIRPICLPKTPHFMPLWMRQVEYPKVFPGDPKVRCFLPPFWMKMIYPGTHNPPDQVIFKVHPQMTRYDVQQYLEKIYDVPVMSVRLKTAYHDLEPIDIPLDERTRRASDPFNLPPKPERYEKLAYVRLSPGSTFTFPDLFKKKRPSDITDVAESSSEFVTQSEKSKESQVDHSSNQESIDVKPIPYKNSHNWFST